MILAVNISEETTFHGVITKCPLVLEYLEFVVILSSQPIGPRCFTLLRVLITSLISSSVISMLIDCKALLVTLARESCWRNVLITWESNILDVANFNKIVQKVCRRY